MEILKMKTTMSGIKFHWTVCKADQTLQVIKKRENKVKRLTLPHFKAYYQATVTKMLSYVKMQANESMEQNTESINRQPQIWLW